MRFIPKIEAIGIFNLTNAKIIRMLHSKLPDSVMVAQKILALFVEVRILVGQPRFQLIIASLRNIGFARSFYRGRLYDSCFKTVRV